MHQRKKNWVLLFGFCLLGYPFAVLGQQTLRVPVATMDAGLISDYAEVHLFNGRAFSPHSSGIVGSANHRDLDITKSCSLIFDGIRYDNVPLMYDLVIDEVIALHPDRLINVILEKHFLSHFTIGTDTFVRIGTDAPGLAPGFYEQIYHGESFVCYAKHHKVIRHYSSGSTLERRYIPGVTFYLLDVRNQTAFQVVKNQRDLLAISKENKRVIRRMLKDAGLSFRSNPEQTLSQVLTYMDRIDSPKEF